MPEGQTLFIEPTVCRADNVVERAQQKESRYQELANDWRVRHKVQPTVVPIVVGTRGVVPNRTIKALETLKNWGFDIKLSRLQKAAVIGSIKIAQKTTWSSG